MGFLGACPVSLGRWHVCIVLLAMGGAAVFHCAEMRLKRCAFWLWKLAEVPLGEPAGGGGVCGRLADGNHPG